jgi:hypothetical protein
MASRSRTPVDELGRGRSPLRRPRGGRGGGDRVVVEKVVSAGPVNYPLLTKTNYNDWALLMKIKLEARLLWAAVDPDDVDFQVDRMALGAICSVVPPELISTLATMRIGVDRVRKASAQKLRRDYEQLTLRDGETVEDFAMRLTGMMNQLATLGDPELDDKIVAKYLRVARPRYRQLVVSIETLLDIESLSVEEVTTRLKAVEDDGVVAGNDGEKLYLTEEEWIERYKQKESDGGRRSSGGGSGSRGKNSSGRKTGSGSDSNGEQTGPPSRGKDKCRKCDKVDHWARECRGRPKREEQAHVAEEDEGTLLLAHAEVIGSDTLPAPNLVRTEAEATKPVAAAQRWPLITSSVPKRRVELVEKEVYTVLGDRGEGDPKRWIFDTGASNHMTGIKEAFADFDTGVVGTVRFGDGSVVQIEGCGTILFACKNGAHQTLHNAYYIPRLTANIVSCGQLDEGGFKILIQDGFMRIRDERMQLLAKI